MEKVDFRPTLAASRRSTRTQKEWKVEIDIDLAESPTSSTTRSRISAAALFVNVIARISPWWARPVASRCAIRWVSTRVFPEPAPATISSGEPECSTAARCGSLSPSTRASAETVPRRGRVSVPGRATEAEGRSGLSKR